jgi:hypothetical protein
MPESSSGASLIISPQITIERPHELFTVGGRYHFTRFIDDEADFLGIGMNRRIPWKSTWNDDRLCYMSYHIGAVSERDWVLTRQVLAGLYYQVEKWDYRVGRMYTHPELLPELLAIPRDHLDLNSDPHLPALVAHLYGAQIWSHPNILPGYVLLATDNAPVHSPLFLFSDQVFGRVYPHPEVGPEAARPTFWELLSE